MQFEEARSEVNSVMAAWELEPPHVQQVARLALQIFDAFSFWHQLPPEDRFLLEAAGLLHDIGHKISENGKRHHKESARLIREHDWTHITRAQVEIIALLARYHRRTPPSLEHEEFVRLEDKDRGRVAILAAILRLADSLDRRHLQAVGRVSFQFSEKDVVCLIESPTHPGPEIAVAKKKGAFLETLLRRPIIYRHLQTPS